MSLFITCVLLSHAKPLSVVDSIQSIYGQEFKDWECTLMDSGTLYDQGFFKDIPCLTDKRFKLIRSWETEEDRKTKLIASWCFNELIRKNMIKSEFVMYLCDDDILYPNAFQSFYDYYQGNKVDAMYGSSDFSGIGKDGNLTFVSEINADIIRGRCVNGGGLDCQVDGGQICHKVSLFDRFPDSEFWPESKSYHMHADGIYLEKIGSIVPIYPVKIKVAHNRKFPSSVNMPTH